MNRFFKIVLHPTEDHPKGESFFLKGQILDNGCYFGWRINSKTLEDDSYIKEGTVYETKNLIYPEAVKKATEYYEDLYYGGLTRKTREQQKKN